MTIGVYQKKRARKKGRKIKRSTVTTVKITDEGYKYLFLEEEEEEKNSTDLRGIWKGSKLIYGSFYSFKQDSLSVR